MPQKAIFCILFVSDFALKRVYYQKHIIILNEIQFLSFIMLFTLCELLKHTSKAGVNYPHCDKIHFLKHVGWGNMVIHFMDNACCCRRLILDEQLKCK